MSAKRIRNLERRMRHAESYEEWYELAAEHDTAAGMDDWRIVERTSMYDYKSIRLRLNRLREKRRNKDDAGLLFTLNEGIHGNMAGMGRPALYNRAKIGTKRLIEEYIDEITHALRHLADQRVKTISVDEKLEFFQRASHCFGRSALMLSGAGSLFYFHLGVVKALHEQGLLPDVISGSSGGAWVCGLVGTHSPNTLARMLEPTRLMHEIHEEVSLWRKLTFGFRRNLTQEDMLRLLQREVPDMTFEEAFNCSGKHINISVAPAEPHQTSRLLNAIASPNVCIREALLASGAVPGVFPPVTLAAKNQQGGRQAYLPSRKWIDGSFNDDLPARRLSRLYGVNHYIASQTNPLILPFLRDVKLRDDAVTLIYQAAQSSGKSWYKAYTALMDRPLRKWPLLYNWMRITKSVIDQEYIADINILPNIKIYNPFTILSYRTEQEIVELIRSGERATWPKIEMIRRTTQISRNLDAIRKRYEAENLALSLRAAS